MAWSEDGLKFIGSSGARSLLLCFRDFCFETSSHKRINVVALISPCIEQIEHLAGRGENHDGGLAVFERLLDGSDNFSQK